LKKIGVIFLYEQQMSKTARKDNYEKDHICP